MEGVNSIATFYMELHFVLVICAAIAFTAPQGEWQASPLTDLIWFCQMCSLAPPRPDQLLISPLFLFIMFEPLKKRGRMQETSVRITGGGWMRVGVREWTESSLSQLPVWERWFYHPWHISMCLKIWCNFLSLSPPTHSLSLCFVC